MELNEVDELLLIIEFSPVLLSIFAYISPLSATAFQVLLSFPKLPVFTPSVATSLSFCFFVAAAECIGFCPNRPIALSSLNFILVSGADGPLADDGCLFLLRCFVHRLVLRCESDAFPHFSNITLFPLFKKEI